MNARTKAANESRDGAWNENERSMSGEMVIKDECALQSKMQRTNASANVGLFSK